MIINLFRYNSRIWWVLFHVLLGMITVSGNVLLISWFYFIIIGTFYLLTFSNINKSLIIVGTMAYIGAFELLARMTKCSPIIPWEASKYLFALLSIIGLILSKKYSQKKIIGSLIIILLIPSIFIDKSGQVISNDIIFNIMGLLNIGLGMIFFSTVQIRKSRFFDLIRMMMYPCISILTYTIIKTPDLSEINFSLGALTSTSGEFGSNQVSTVLGWGFLLLSIACILNWKITGSRIADGLLAAVFLIQGLFTFSRGGVIGGGIGLLIFLYILFYKSGQKFTIPRSVKMYAGPALILFILAIVYVNDLTKGNLLLRYQGETFGTVSGTRDRDLSTMTSGRDVIFLSDIELWLENPILGSGAGTSKYIRSEGQGTAAHVELSRLMAENGIPGIIIFLLILYSGYSYFSEKDSIIKAIKLAFFALAFFTTFHSATRTFITPLLLSFCTINVSGSKQSK